MINGSITGIVIFAIWLVCQLCIAADIGSICNKPALAGNNDQVMITDKGRHRREQFRHTDELEWKETPKRLGKLSSTTRREDRVGGRHKILKSHHKESEFT
jgi:hypothetical protein